MQQKSISDSDACDLNKYSVQALLGTNLFFRNKNKSEKHKWRSTVEKVSLIKIVALIKTGS